MSRVPPARSTRHGALENIFITLHELRTRISAVQIGEPTRLLYIDLGAWRGHGCNRISWSCEKNLEKKSGKPVAGLCPIDDAAGPISGALEGWRKFIETWPDRV